MIDIEKKKNQYRPILHLVHLIVDHLIYLSTIILDT